MKIIYIMDIEEGQNSHEIAREAVHLVLGTDNEYLENLLVRKIEGKRRKSTTLKEVFQKKDRKPLKESLERKTNISRETSMRVLKKEPDAEEMENKTVSSWVMNTLLQEKLIDREKQENDNRWKHINGILAVVLPIVSGLVNFLLSYYLKTCENSS